MEIEAGSRRFVVLGEIKLVATGRKDPCPLRPVSDLFAV